MIITEIAFSEKAVECIDSATDDYRSRLCQLAEEFAFNEDLSVVMPRHIIEANKQLMAIAEQKKDQVTQEKQPIDSDSVKSPHNPSSSPKINLTDSESTFGGRSETWHNGETQTSQKSRELAATV